MANLSGVFVNTAKPPQMNIITPFLIGLNSLQSNRFYIKAVTIYGKDIGNAFVWLIRSIIVLLVIQLRL